MRFDLKKPQLFPFSKASFTLSLFIGLFSPIQNSPLLVLCSLGSSLQSQASSSLHSILQPLFTSHLLIYLPLKPFSGKPEMISQMSSFR